MENKNNRAQAMVIVFVYITVCALVGVYMMLYAANLRQVVARNINHTQAVYAGEAGLIHAYIQMYSNNLNGSPGTPGGTYLFPAITGGEQIKVDISSTPAGAYTQIRATVSNWQK